MVQLPCGPRHELHQGCAHTWLFVKAECPVCGYSLKKARGVNSSMEAVNYKLQGP